jgi:hypothetical protein
MLHSTEQGGMKGMLSKVLINNGKAETFRLAVSLCVCFLRLPICNLKNGRTVIAAKAAYDSTQLTNCSPFIPSKCLTLFVTSV